MKKHNEGYVLVLVLVVVIVLCLVASAILSGALYNINAQHAQIEKMQEQYAAEGEIEKVYSQLKQVTDNESLTAICGDTVTVSVVEVRALEHYVAIQLSTKPVSDGAQIVQCTIKLTGATVTDDAGDETKFTISDISKVEYTEFDIVAGGEAK